MASHPVISVQGLTKRYGSTVAVADVSFEVQAGEIFGLLGPNGAGKTTTVECLQGLRPADGGRLRVLGFNPQEQAQALRRKIGCQLQESALPHRIKVWEALQWFASFSPNSGNWNELIDQWGLSEKRNAYFSDLSGGQRQRLFVALALVNDPEVVFLDEMTTGLDPAARRVAWDLIQSIRERGTTVVLVTHFMDEAEHLCDRLAVVNEGRIAAMDTPRGLVSAHTREVTVRFTAPESDLSWLRDLSVVTDVNVRDRAVEVTGTGPVVVDVAAELVAHGIRPVDLRVDQPTLEDVFLRITGTRMEE